MAYKFCPFCGITVGTAKIDRKEKKKNSERMIRHCPGCGEDLLELHLSPGYSGKEAVKADLFSDNIIQRSRVVGISMTPSEDPEDRDTGRNVKPDQAAGGISDSIIQRSVVTSIGSINISKDAMCPLCGNALSDRNILKDCPRCSINVCGLCRSRSHDERQKRYRGYRLDHTEGLCPQCNRIETTELKKDIEDKITKGSSYLKKMEEMIADYTQEEKELLSSGNGLVSKGDLQSALEVFGTLLDINENNIGGLEGKWSILMELGYFRKAVEVIEESLKSYPWITGAHVSLGEAFFRLGEEDKAKAVLIKALDVEGVEKEVILIKIGELYLLMNQPGRAASVLERSLTLTRDVDNKRFVEPYIYLASIYLGNGDYLKAREYITEGRKIDRDNPDLLKVLEDLSDLWRACLESVRHSRDNLKQETDEKSRIRNLRIIISGLLSMGKKAKAQRYAKELADISPGDNLLNNPKLI